MLHSAFLTLLFAGFASSCFIIVFVRPQITTTTAATESRANAVSLSTIYIKTGTINHANSDCKAVLKICDTINCCETTSQGGGLDDLLKNDREKGEIDEYSGSSLLNTCAQAILDPKVPWTAKLTTSDPNGSDGWFVEWIGLVADGMTYRCPVGGWLDNGAGAAGPNTRTAKCYISPAQIMTTTAATTTTATTTTTSTTTTATTNTTTTTPTTTTTVAPGRKRRSVEEKIREKRSANAAPVIRKKRSADECFKLKTLEEMAFQYCHHVEGGFTWEDVLECEKSVGNITLPVAMPTKVVFAWMDGLGDGDGVLTMVEWYNIVGCSED